MAASRSSSTRPTSSRPGSPRTRSESASRSKRSTRTTSPADLLELRLFTEITDGIEAARVAERIEQELVDLLGGATVTIEAERHWSEPYNYELAVGVTPHGDAIEALEILAEAGGNGWLACSDDGWRCDLWWSSARDPDAMLVVPEVHGAEVAFIPWSDPSRRPPTSGRSSSSPSRTTSPRSPASQTRSRAMKKPDVPCPCGVVSRNSGRFGCANAGHSSPSGSGSRPAASTTASFSSAFSVQTE